MKSMSSGWKEPETIGFDCFLSGSVQSGKPHYFLAHRGERYPISKGAVTSLKNHFKAVNCKTGRWKDRFEVQDYGGTVRFSFSASSVSGLTHFEGAFKSLSAPSAVA